MRWTQYKVKHYPQHGDTRIVFHFLFVPRTINNETRWLEFATIKQQFNVSKTDFYDFWSDIAWVNQ